MIPIEHFRTKTLINYAQFQKDKRSLIKNLNKKYKPIRFDEFDINPYPLRFDKALIHQINDCHSLLIEAIHKIVTNFFCDPALQQIISLNNKTLKLLQHLKDKPYEIGAIRPDFLFDKRYQIKICEINARFPLNSFILLHCLYNEMHKDFAGKISYNAKMLKIVEVFTKFFDNKQPIHIYFYKEKSFDIFLLKNLLRKTSPNLKWKLPISSEFLFTNKLIKGNNYSQIILNLHQEELLNLEPDLFNEINASTYFNDIRTIFIVHDKRLLSILSNKTIMSKYISSEKCNRLASYIVPTYLLSDSTVQTIKSNPKNWVLKKNSAGKGEGMYIGKETPLTEISTVLNEKKSDYIAQPFLGQPLFLLLNDSSKNRNANYDGYQTIYLVGSILSFNNALLGPGILRGSRKTIVNVAQGNTTIFVPMY
ncbi:hypothetical protein [Rickettsiella endosymbiont of Aleochara curtula]|uniref:hypothetical protein n=1 Tax=Rickettsiella endosymbiont of Aleochara curtula TaxID=3077936 RepID=UPI00313A9FBB